MQRAIRGLTVLVAAWAAAGGAVVAQEEGLSSGLIRSAAAMLDSNDPPAEEFALRLITVLVGIENLDEYRRAALADALERSEVLTRVNQLAGRPGTVGALATALAGSLRTRLGLDSMGQAQAIDPFAGVGITLESPVEDFRWARFPAAAGTTYSVSVEGCDYTTVSVFDADLRKLVGREIYDYSGAVFVPAVDNAGDLHVRLHSTGVCVGPFTVAVATGPDADSFLALADRRSDAPEIEVGRTYTVRVSDRDQHWLRFSAELGTLYSITTSDLRGGADSILTLAGSDGEQLQYNDDDFGLASRIQWTPRAAGPHYVAVEDLNASGGEFDLRIERLADVDVAASVPAGRSFDDAPVFPVGTGVVAVDVAGREYGYFTLELERGTIVYLESNAFLNVVAPDGAEAVELQATPAAGDPSAFLEGAYYIATTGGRHIIEIDAFLEDLVLLRVTLNPFQMPVPQ